MTHNALIDFDVRFGQPVSFLLRQNFQTFAAGLSSAMEEAERRKRENSWIYRFFLVVKL